MADRIKGQEVSLTITSSRGVESAIQDIQSIEFQYDRDILSEGYLGQTTEQKDDIFKGISGSLEAHMRSAEALDLVTRINNVSKRRLPGESIEIAATMNFPDGRRRVIIPNAKFGNIPFRASGRDEFVSLSMDFAADDGRTVATS